MSKSKSVNTIAQALRRIKEVKGRIATLNARLHQSINWVGEEKPLFDFAELESERQALVDELVELKTALLATNSRTAAGNSQPKGDPRHFRYR